MPGGESVPSLVSRGGTADVPGPVMPRDAGVASHPATPSTTTNASARTTVPPVSCVDPSALPRVRLPLPDGALAVAPHGRPLAPVAALRALAAVVQRGQRQVRAVARRAPPAVGLARHGPPAAVGMARHAPPAASVLAWHEPAPAGQARHALRMVAPEPRRAHA